MWSALLACTDTIPFSSTSICDRARDPDHRERVHRPADTRGPHGPALRAECQQLPRLRRPVLVLRGPRRPLRPDDLGTIMPGPAGLNGRQMRYDQAVEHAILTFRDARRCPLDAHSVRGPRRADPWHVTVLLATLGQSLPEPGPAEPPEALQTPEAPAPPGPDGDLAAPGGSS